MLKVNNLNVFYGGAQALWNLSFEVTQGKIVTLVGANGAGKTTTLRTISGLMRAASGKIEYLGKDLSHMEPDRVVRLGISHVPEGRQLFPNLTVLENLELGAYAKEARKNIKDSMEWVMQLFPILGKRRTQLAGTLSGGEQQMLAIGRALMSRPKLLMLDEPSLGLSPLMVEKVFEVITYLNKQQVTILLVEQNVVEALEIANDAYVLEVGKIVLCGSAENLRTSGYVQKAYMGFH